MRKRYYIPSAGRANHRLTTLEHFPHDQCVLVVPPGDVKSYEAAHPDVDVVAGPAEKGIGLTRKFIIRLAGEDHWQFDDDLRFRCIQSPSYATPRNIVTDRPWIYWLQRVEREVTWDRRASMGGIGQQFLGSVHLKNGLIQYGRPVYRTLYVSYEAMKDVPLENYPVYEDVVMNIHAAQRGGLVACYGAVSQDWSSGKDDVGGCSTYRDPALVRQCLDRLVADYPGLVSVQVNPRHSTHGMKLGFGMRVAWRKLRKS